MRSKKSKIVKELDPQELEGISEARIEHYLALGYLPYLDEQSHVKWLTQAQMSMRGISNRSVRAQVPFRRFPKRKKSQYRKKRSRRNAFQFFWDNWVLITVSLIVFIFLIIAFLNPELIF